MTYPKLCYAIKFNCEHLKEGKHANVSRRCKGNPLSIVNFAYQIILTKRFRFISVERLAIAKQIDMILMSGVYKINEDKCNENDVFFCFNCGVWL
jgi:hypothetical protein